ncbi:MAG: acyl-CoA dehydrogenase family protein [Deltaproteobacteria bacterium]|nr:acyl-CoA dehydrogenase family protein [Deltaproteobacteria bacterium]
MFLELSEEQRLIRDSVRRFVEMEVKPHAARFDKNQEFPQAAVKGLSELGLMGMFTSPDLGGAGLDAVTGALVIEEIARHDGSLALTVASHNGLCSAHLRLAGNDEQKRRFLPDLASGKKLGAWALTEPGSGSDASGLRTTAAKRKDRWILNGSKTFITQGTVGEVFVVLALTAPEKKQHGITAFVLERGMRGFTQRSIHDKLGMRASDTAELFFEDVEVPEENRLGSLDRGFIDTLKILDRGRITIAALGVGIARGSVEEARAYALERRQFGKPIAEFQAIQWMISDMATETDAARLLTHHAAALHDSGEPYSLAAAKAKLYASEAAVRAATKAIQVHGGYGYTKDFPVERYLRDAKLLEIGEGTSEIQRMVIARHVLQS